MKTQQLLVALTVANAALLVFSLTHPRPTTAQDFAPVLRGRALEILDDQGRVRAQIRVLPAQPNAGMPDGTTGYPEAVQLRQIDTKGGPHAKLGTTQAGSAVRLAGERRLYTPRLPRGATP